MKLFYLLLLLPILASSQVKFRDSVKVKTAIYEVIYSEYLESPLWVQYEVKCPSGKASRKGMDFYTNDSIHTSDAKDYVGNSYDKGHMAPAADFNCTKEMLYMTFSFLNCALQDQYLNRGVWRLLEAQEREWANVEPVKVTIEVKFSKKSLRLETGATVPDGFVKKIELKKSKKVFRYYFPNSRPTHSKYSDYLIK
jgi:endonuclease G